MSAPANAPPAAPPRSRLTPARLLLAVAFAAVGFVAVWQGFALAGFGTDVHALRVVGAIGSLFGCGLVVVWPNLKSIGRVIFAFLGVGCALAVWWFGPCKPDMGGLGGAITMRKEFKEEMRKPLRENMFHAPEHRDRLFWLVSEFPSLTPGLRAEYEQWLAQAEKSLTDDIRQLSAEDLPRAVVLQKEVKDLTVLDREIGERVLRELWAWTDRAAKAKIAELNQLPPGDWDAFNRTAPGRKALAEAFRETLDPLLQAESAWVDRWFEPFQPHPARGILPRLNWCSVEKSILALQSLDTEETRFENARAACFVLAHEVTELDVAAHLAARRYNRAFGLARTHAVEWNATATLLGPDVVKKLDALREKCAALVTPDSVDPSPADEPEIAPPPRTKPEK